MLVTFTTNAYANITMFGDVAITILKMMEEVPAALNRLSAAIDANKSSPPVADKNADEPAVSMAHRAMPLINLLAAAAKADSDVMWK
jgi:myo-inositol-hexaphosphate 3-phosphohydrolase